MVSIKGKHDRNVVDSMLSKRLVMAVEGNGGTIGGRGGGVGMGVGGGGIGRGDSRGDGLGKDGGEYDGTAAVMVVQVVMVQEGFRVILFLCLRFRHYSWIFVVRGKLRLDSLISFDFNNVTCM